MAFFHILKDEAQAGPESRLRSAGLANVKLDQPELMDSDITKRHLIFISFLRLMLFSYVHH